MDRGAWQPAAHGVAKGRTQLCQQTFTFLPTSVWETLIYGNTFIMCLSYWDFLIPGILKINSET